MAAYIDKNPENNISYCVGNTISTLPVYFFAIAVILNINKW